MSATVIAETAQSLVCTNVSVRVGHRELVTPFSWAHATGGIAWLFGNNGSGKSSLLRVLAGWQRPATGQVAWSGEAPARIHYLAPVMTGPPDVRVCDFVELVESLSDGAENDQLQALLPQLTDETNRFRTLSTGEAKRLLLWSILRQHPQPLILDEPYEHLSRDAKWVLTMLLRRWAEQAVVVVATNQDVPMQAPDTIRALNGTLLEVIAVS